MLTPAENKKARLTPLLLTLISVVLVVLNLIRIFNVSLTEDEASSHYLAPYSEFINMDFVTANVHIFNSIARKFFIELLGNTDFNLRLPSLLAQLIFLAYCARLCIKLFKNQWWQIAAFLLFNLNPFSFEFWGYSRGYSLSIAFMIMSVYHLLTHIESRRFRQLYVCLLAAILSVYSNFATLYFYMALAAVLIIEPLLFTDSLSRKLYIKRMIALLVATAILAMLIAKPLYKLQKGDQLFFGATHGLFCNTICSLVYESFFQHGEISDTTTIVSYVFASLFFSAGFYWAYLFIKDRKDPAIKWGAIFWLLLGISLLGNKMQHTLMGSKYLLQRTALFFIPLYILQLSYFLHHLSKGKYKLISNIIFYLLTGIMLINFALHLNFDRSRTWWFDQYDRLALKRMVDQSRNNPNKIKVRVNWIFAAPLGQEAGVIYKGRFEQINYTMDKPDPKDTSFDFYYIESEEVQYVSPRYVVDTCFDNQTDYCLLRKH